MKSIISLSLTILFALRLAAAERPNIVLILADDLGFSDIGCYGGEIKTPNIDKLAATGLRFSQFYNGARCCPTRASLLTGLYPHQHGVTGNDLALSDSSVNPQTARSDPRFERVYNTIVENFRAQPNFVRDLTARGYRTLETGKWWEGDPIKVGGFTRSVTMRQ